MVDQLSLSKGKATGHHHRQFGQGGDHHAADDEPLGDPPDHPPDSSHRRPWLILIDTRPFRRASILQLLRSQARGFRVLAPKDGTMLDPDDEPDEGEVGLVVLSVGGTHLTEHHLQENIRRLRRWSCEAPVVVVSDSDDPNDIIEAFRQGVRGYIPTALEPAVATEALRLVHAGGTFVPSVMVSAFEETGPADDARTGKGFTAREQDVLALLCEGKPNKVIARELDLTETTVKVHVRHIMRKLGAHNRTEAVLLAQRLDPEQN